MSKQTVLNSLAAILITAAVLAAPCPALADGYRLGVGDRLRVKVQEWPDLTGEYQVGPSSTLSLPAAGEIPAAGLTTSEAAAAIADRLRTIAKLPAPPACAVEIVQFRPFFILGDVQKPGEYAYRPGLTVMQAVSIAGGYYRPAENAFRLERDAITAQGDVTLLMHTAQRLAARIARLEAEEKHAAGVTFPPMLDAAADAVIMDGERAIFTANNEALAKTLESLARYTKLYEQEIETVKSQIESETRQYDSVKKEFDSIKSLADKGLATLPRQWAAERALAQIQSTMRGLEATVLRARQNISQTEQRRIDVLNGRTDRINGDLQKARAEARDTAARLKTSRGLLMEASVIAPALYAAGGQPMPEPVFTVERGGNGTADTLSGDGLMAPGDVLTVERRLTPAMARLEGSGPPSPQANAGPLGAAP